MRVATELPYANTDLLALCCFRGQLLLRRRQLETKRAKVRNTVEYLEEGLGGEDDDYDDRGVVAVLCLAVGTGLFAILCREWGFGHGLGFTVRAFVWSRLQHRHAG